MSRRPILRCCCALALSVVTIISAACANPPSKEMDQAQGAIDAARAAGADRYATTEYLAATEALKNANTAVAASDYRLALNYALESREQAQNAARGAADAKGRVRGEVDRALMETTTLITQGRTRLQTAAKARAPRRIVAPQTAALDAAEADLQKAGETIAAEDYLAAREMLGDIRMRVEAILAEIPAAELTVEGRGRQ
jgi:hypothetical protein